MYTAWKKEYSVGWVNFQDYIVELEKIQDQPEKRLNSRVNRNELIMINNSSNRLMFLQVMPK